MRSVPTDLAKNYSILLVSRGIPPKNHYHFQKWLRYYMDYCHEYQYHIQRQRQPAPFREEITRKKPEHVSHSNDDVKRFLTFLAVKRKVAASTQNQALNAVLFLFRHIVKTEFGDLKGTVRAKKKPYIPVVLSREEIDIHIQNEKTVLIFNDLEVFS